MQIHVLIDHMGHHARLLDHNWQWVRVIGHVNIMKMLSSLILLTAVAFSLQAQSTIILDSGDESTLASHGFRFINPSQVQMQTLDNAIGKLIVAKKETKAQIRTIDQAVVYLWKNINITVIQTPRVCTEYRGYFWFSRLDWAKKDDETFQSGIAVKRGAGEIYRWEHQQRSE